MVAAAAAEERRKAAARAALARLLGRDKGVRGGAGGGAAGTIDGSAHAGALPARVAERPRAAPEVIALSSDSDGDEALWAQKSDLSPTRLTLTLTDTASLRAALLLNGRSGASPELAKPLLLAYLRARGVAIEEVGEFFLDGTYRQ